MGILSNARSSRSPEFQSNRADMRRSDARRKFLLLLAHGPSPLLRLRSRGHAFLSADDVWPSDVCPTARRRAAADDVLHPVRTALRHLAVQFHDQDCLRRAAV